MNRYKVEYDKRTIFCYEIEAENEEEATRKATALFNKGEEPHQIILVEAELLETNQIEG